MPRVHKTVACRFLWLVLARAGSRWVPTFPRLAFGTESLSKMTMLVAPGMSINTPAVASIRRIMRIPFHSENVIGGIGTSRRAINYTTI